MTWNMIDTLTLVLRPNNSAEENALDDYDRGYIIKGCSLWY